MQSTLSGGVVIGWYSPRGSVTEGGANRRQRGSKQQSGQGFGLVCFFVCVLST